MRINPWFFVFFPFFLFCRATGQSSIKLLQLANYDLTSSGGKNVFYYAEMNARGLIKIIDKSEQENRSFSVQLTTSEIKELDKIFNPSKPLRKYLIKTKFDSGVHYAGNYSFLYFSSIGGKKDSISYIRAFMSKEFNSAIDKIENLSQHHQYYNKDMVLEDTRFIQALTNSHERSNYLPKIEQPPPAKF